MSVIALRCVSCDTAHDPSAVCTTCPHCGLEGIVDVEYDYDRVGAALNADSLAACGLTTIWRYRAALPVAQHGPLPGLCVGPTPVYEAARLARALGLGRLWVKDEGRNPTGSFKDRASAVGVARAIAEGATQVACASTGNAASSVAGFCAEAGLHARIFVPHSAPPAKVTQLLAYGATVFLVQGGYGPAFDLCQQAVGTFGWYNRNCAVNPYLVEGKKTGGFEIAEQLRDQLPDVVVVPVGDGCIISGVGKGLMEMHQLGLIDRVPRLIGVQAAGVAPIAAAFDRGADRLEPVAGQGHTAADSINVAAPRNWRKALRIVRRSAGSFVTVDDDEIFAWLPRVGALCGVFAEPTAVAAVAGARRAAERGLIDRHESVLVLLTGSGLKDVGAAAATLSLPPPIAANIEEVRRVVSMA